MRVLYRDDDYVVYHSKTGNYAAYAIRDGVFGPLFQSRTKTAAVRQAKRWAAGVRVISGLTHAAELADNGDIVAARRLVERLLKTDLARTMHAETP